jgi:hypothetical protein
VRDENRESITRSKIAGKGGSNAIFVGQAFEAEDNWVNTVTTSHFLANLAL